MDLQTAAELQVVLEGVGLPAEKQELVSYARDQDASATQIGLLRSLPDREYETIDEVAEELINVQPEREQEVPHEPREESGRPPGGDDYTEKHPVRGAVRE